MRLHLPFQVLVYIYCNIPTGKLHVQVVRTIWPSGTVRVLDPRMLEIPGSIPLIEKEVLPYMTDTCISFCFFQQVHHCTLCRKKLLGQFIIYIIAFVQNQNYRRTRHTHAQSHSEDGRQSQINEIYSLMNFSDFARALKPIALNRALLASQ
jgi:hypothetical protein